MEIIAHKQVKQKIKRLAIEILEHNYDQKVIYLMGVNNNGYRFAKLIQKEMQLWGKVEVHMINVRLNAAHPLKDEITISVDSKTLSGQNVVVVDDVANSGRTLYFATKPLLNILPRKIEAAVLVDRMHKLFPIKVDYVGMSLATTLKQNIQVDLDDGRAFSVLLD